MSSSSLSTSDQDACRSTSSSSKQQALPNRQPSSSSFKFTMIPPLSRTVVTASASSEVDNRVTKQAPPNDLCKENHPRKIRSSSPNQQNHYPNVEESFSTSSTLKQESPAVFSRLGTMNTSASSSVSRSVSSSSRFLLRPGETMDEFFGMKSLQDLANDTEYNQLCQTVTYDPQSADDASIWNVILNKATAAYKKNKQQQQLQPHDELTPTASVTSHFNLLRLHRRATSRSLRNSVSNPSCVMDVWLSYAKCQAMFGLYNDARWSWQHVEPSHNTNTTGNGNVPVPAHYYITVADLEALQGNVDAAREMVQKGLAQQAEPRSVLEQRLAELLPPPTAELDPTTTAGSTKSPRKRPLEDDHEPSNLSACGGASTSPKRFKVTPSQNSPTVPQPLQDSSQQQQVPQPLSFQTQKRRPLATLASTTSDTPLSLRPTLPPPLNSTTDGPSEKFSLAVETPSSTVVPPTAPSLLTSTNAIELRKPRDACAMPSLRRPLSSSPSEYDGAVHSIPSKNSVDSILEGEQQKKPIVEAAAAASASTNGTISQLPDPKALHSSDITPRRPPLAHRSVNGATTASSAVGNPSSLSKVLSSNRRPLSLLGRTARSGSLGMPQRVDPNFNLFVMAEMDNTDDTTEALEEGDTASRSPVGDTNAAEDTDNPTTRSSDSNGKTPPRKVNLDISYMWEWDPTKTRPKSAEADHNSGLDDDSTDAMAAVVKPANLTATCQSPATPCLQRIDEGLPLSSSSKQPSPSPHAKLDAPDSESRRTKRRHSQTTAANTSNINVSDAETSALLAKTNREFLQLVSEANIVRVNNVPYVKLGVIGKGGSCKVYRALSKDCSVVAIKKVKLAGMDKKAISGYANEIALLKKLRGNPAIIQMYDSEVDLKRKAIFVVMEQGETDLSHVLQQQQIVVQHGSGGPDGNGTAARRHLNMNFIRLTWQQMLNAVHCIHEARIIHGDLKPPNFLFVRGALKLIDFGIAKAIQSDDTTNIYRESQIGTVNYMSPEAICGTGTGRNGGPHIRIGRASDVWSLGCILYQMVYGRTPFADLHMVQKLQAIINPNYNIPFPDTVDEAAIDVMKQCLRRKPEERPPIVGPNGLLNEHRFLNSRPHSTADAPK